MHNPAISPYLEHLLWVQTFYTDLVLSHSSTNFSLEKQKLPENSEALVETFQVLFIRDFTIESADKELQNIWNSACDSLCFKNSAEHIIDAQ